MNSRFRPSVRLVGWYMISEITIPCRREDGPNGSLGKERKEKSMGRAVASKKVRCVLARIVFGVLARSRTVFTVNVFVMFAGMGVVVRIIVRESIPNVARRTLIPLLMV